ncbi:VWA domain-containing protein [Naumannella sp. ID2617S]|nr:VWA domain-containing protein [Naumannella sp. ID2617S]
MTQPVGVRHQVDEVLLGFVAAVRAAGVPAGPDRAQAFLAATALVGLDDAAAVRAASRATLCAHPDDLHRLDQVFESWFSARDQSPGMMPPDREPVPLRTLALDDFPPGGTAGDESDAVRAAASQVEVLRRRDVSELTPDERRLLGALLEQLPIRLPTRRATRHSRAPRGQVDARRTLRASLRQWGEPAQISHRRRGRRPRPVVLLLDVSGSMEGYAEVLLRLAHRYVQAAGAGSGRHPVEAFTLGTRLTRLTRAMQHRDVEQAMRAVAQTVPDFSGGTRLGETLRAFTERWGRRGLARGAVVVIVSDGWERGDCTLLAEQVRQLGRLAHRVIWANPHRGRTGYQPVQAGIVAVLPHLDAFVAGHSLAAYTELAEVVADA